MVDPIWEILCSPNFYYIHMCIDNTMHWMIPFWRYVSSNLKQDGKAFQSLAAQNMTKIKKKSHGFCSTSDRIKTLTPTTFLL
jgi:hypothetical protein